MKSTALALIAAFALPAAAFAQSNHDDWTSFSKDGRCWAATAPSSSVGNIQGRADPYLSITNFPEEGVRGSVAVVAGYDRVSESQVELRVNDDEFEVLPFKNAAFTASGDPEAKLIAAMRRGKELVVTWKHGNSEATDTYSLMGFTAAKQAIDSACR